MTGTGTVRLEIVPWLTEAFGHGGAARLMLDAEVSGETSLGDLLAALAAEHPGIGAVLVDLEAGCVFEHVSVVHNDTVLGAHAALAARIRPGDSLVFLPAFSGG